MSWGKEVRKRLVDMDKTLTEMAEALLYEPTYVSRVVRESNPTPRMRKAINNYVGIEEDKEAKQ